jgi:DNA-binding transcriptional MerR regulator
MNKTSKKLVGGFMVVILVATIGVIIVSAQNDETSGKAAENTTFWGRRQMCGPEPFASNITKINCFFYNLTEEQQTELNELVQSLKEQGANFSEIRKAIQEKLDEWGILDKQLDNEIAQTEQRLSILNREKELRDQGYNWEEINQIIQDEFGLKAPVGESQGMMFRHGDDHGFRGDSDSCR